jgi:hypothetical protein
MMKGARYKVQGRIKDIFALYIVPCALSLTPSDFLLHALCSMPYAYTREVRLLLIKTYEFGSYSY